MWGSSRCPEAVLEWMNQSVCHHLITKKKKEGKKNCLTGIKRILHVLAHFAVWRRWIRDFYFVPKDSDQCGILTEQSEEKCGDLFCLCALPQFASSNWPVITNLKNTADVRYDHASNVHQWGRFVEQTSAAVRNTVPKHAKNWKCASMCQEEDRNFRLRVCVRAGMCVIKPRYSAGLHSSTADLEKLFRGDCPTYPLRHNPPDSLFVLSV